VSEASVSAAPASPAERAPQVIAIVGATATGKSAVALSVAERLGGEIVNADSMQFYRGMDIGTAKLSVEERCGIPHHQLDTLDVHQDASVAKFQEQARADIDAIHARGRRAIVCGGSGLYLRALLDRFEFPGTDEAIRARLEERARVEGPGMLHRELASLDPVAAQRIQPQNAKRIVRALEVIEITGEKYSSNLPEHEYEIPAVQVALRLDYAPLDERIDARVERMWSSGLVDEVSDLVGRGIREGVTARRAVGYAETLRHLEGELSAEETQALIAQNTRRLARRQARWFVPDPRVTWIDAPASASDIDRAVGDVLLAAGS
jgi:tRNA dimethylallyltransferase